MRARRAFTLLELLLAVSLTAMVTTAAGAALTAARRTAERVSASSGRAQQDARWRARLGAMLRHPPLPERVQEPLLALGAGDAGPELRFLTVGVNQPFGTGTIWRAVVRADTTGLLLRAEPLNGDQGAAPLEYHLEDAVLETVEVLDPTEVSGTASRWRTDWPQASQRPIAVALTWRERGQEGATVPTTFVQLLNPLQAVGR